MNYLLKLRKDNGLTQQDLAGYLGVSRGLISLVEKGLRELPKEAQKKLANIENVIALDDLGKQMEMESVTLDQEATRQLKDYHKMKAEDYLYKAEGLRLQLEALLKSRKKTGAKFKLVKGLKRNKPGAGKNKTDRTWTDYHEQQSSEKLSKYLSTIQMLTYDIEVLKGYAAVHENVLKKIF